MKGNIWAVAVVAVLLALVLPAVNIGQQQNAFTANVTNESVTVDYANNTTVSKADIAVKFYDNETITNSSGGELAEGTDYRWDTKTGTIDWLNASNTTDGESAEIDYTYDYHSESVRGAQGIAARFGGFIGFFFLMVVIGAVLTYSFGGGGF